MQTDVVSIYSCHKRHPFLSFSFRSQSRNYEQIPIILRKMNATDEQHVDSARAELRQIQSNVESGDNNWNAHVSTARRIIASIDSTPLMQCPDRAADQTSIISGLQNLAYHDADLGGVQDIADWCVSQWLSIMQRDLENVDALQGMLLPPAFPTTMSGLANDRTDHV